MNFDSFKHYRTGISSIDAEHWWLLHLVSTTASIHDTEEAGFVMNKLLEDWNRHSGLEEDLMQAASFPHLEAHRQDHQQIAAALQAMYQAVCIQGALTQAQWKAHDLEEKVRNHIDHYDMQYIPYVRTP